MEVSMRDLYQMLRERKWVFGTVLLFFAAFFLWYGSRPGKELHAADCVVMDSEGREVPGEYELRRATDTFYIRGAATSDTFQWSSANTDILEVDESTASTSTVRVNVKSIGRVALRVLVSHADGTADDLSVSVNVVFSVNEYLDTTNPNVSISRVNEGDKRRSLVMDYNETLFLGESARREPNKLNLIFGSAKDTNAVWTSSNADVLTVIQDSAEPNVHAAGAGHAKLSVTYRDGTNEYEDTIDVYVRPELHKDNSAGQIVGTDSHTPPGEIDQRAFIEIERNDKLWPSVRFNSNPLESINEKLTWVIARRDTDRTFVCDSLGNRGVNPDDAKLVFDTQDGTFRVDAKAGEYIIQFYVRGTYTSFEAAQKQEFWGCEPVSVNVDVVSTYSNKDITLNINGKYNLSDAFNIPLDVLTGCFSVNGEEQSPTGCIEWDRGKMEITGMVKGTATFQVRCNQRPTRTIPGVAEGDTITVRITVTDTFSLNVTNTTMAVGAKLELTGIIGSGNYTDSSTFRWDTSDPSETYISLSSSGQYATVTAKRATLTDSPVIVTLYWTDDDAITRVATCRIFVNTAATTIPLDRSEMEMEVGSIDYLDSGLSGEQNLTWISADTNIVTVEPQKGNVTAKLTAGKTTGSTIVTVINKDNNVYATCRVTVTAAITSISIEQGEQIDTYLSTGLIFLKAVYEPKNATNTQLKWSTSDRSVATVDENGMVTLLKEDTVWISVEPVFNPKNIVARCCINIRKNPITNIETDVSKLDLVVGEQYVVQTTITPPDATDPTLKWASDNLGVAKVEGGVITAVAPGHANITVANGEIFRIIEVNVRNRLLSISFKESEYEMKVGTTIALRNAVIFNPDKDINMNLSWSSTDDSIVSVDEEGNITANEEGMAWITCVSEDIGVTGAITCGIRVVNTDIPAIDVELVPDQASIFIGESVKIEPVFDPVTATYQTMSWTSTDPDIAEVDEDGVVTGISVGQTTITAVYKDPITGDVWEPVYCSIEVRNELLSIEFKEDEYTVREGASLALMEELIFDPEEDVNKTVSWSSTNEDVAVVDAEGNVTGMKSGDTAWITCVSEELGVEEAITCAIHVIDSDVPAKSMTLDPETASIYVGDTLQINAVFDPEDATYQTVTWSSANEEIATVDENGLVTGEAEGVVSISAVYKDPYTGDVWDPLYCTVQVLKPLVPVTGVQVTPKEQNVFIGGSFQLQAAVQPEDASDKSVTYQSSDTNVATVDEKGIVTGVASGSAVVICRTVEGGFVDTCNVTVTSEVSISLSPTYRELAIDHTFQLKKTILPEKYADLPVTWDSTDYNVADVDSDGLVTGIDKGECTIICTVDDYNVTASCKVKVSTLKTKITLSKTKIRMGVGETYKLKATTESNGTKRKPAVKWKTSNKKIVTVGSKGRLRAKKLGFATITATTKDAAKAKAKCKVRVIYRAKKVRIKPNYAVCYVGGTCSLKAVVGPKRASIKSVSWKSSDPKIAKVQDGTVRGVAEGTVTITAKVKDGSGKRANCTVKVMEPVNASSIVVAQADLTMKRGDSTKLSYTVLPEDTSDNISFASDNKRVATVSSNGTVRAVGTGNCTITILASGGVSSTVSVNVVALNRSTLTMRQYDTETLVVNGLASGDTATWHSANAGVATVDGNGLVVGRSIGTTYIYAYVKGCRMACRVTITHLD